MKFKKITAVFTATVMALSMATAASAEDNFDTTLASNSISAEMSIDNDFNDDIDGSENGAVTYAATKTLDELKEEYPDGSHYTYNGNACTTHAGCSWTKSCNCINYDDSIQCVAFAKYVYYNLRGKKWSTSDRTYLNIKNPNGATLKSYLQGKPSGTYINFDTANGGNHSLVIIATSSVGITVYEANSDPNDLCGVSYDSYTWDKFATRFSELVHYVY